MPDTSVPAAIRALIEQRRGIRLDIGAGERKQGPEWIGMDIRDLPGVDLIWDVEQYPWPFPDECVVMALASHIIEHINPAKMGMIRFMDELWRVMIPDGKVAIAVPYPTSHGALQDPTHINLRNETCFRYFDPIDQQVGDKLYRIYRPKPWAIEQLAWDPCQSIEVVMRKRRWDPSYAGNGTWGVDRP